MKKNIDYQKNATGIQTVDEYRPNDVLITNTMLKAVAACLRQDKIEIGHLVDLGNFLEAVILHDRLLIHPYDSPLGENESFYNKLSQEGILYNTHPVEIENVNTVSMELIKDVLSEGYKPDQKQEMVNKMGKILKEDIRNWSWTDDRGHISYLQPFSRDIIEAIESVEPISPDYFYDAAHYFGTHHSTGLFINIVWNSHVITYWILWDKLSLSYYPSFDRLHSTELINQKLHSSLTEKAYRVVADSLDSNVSDLKDYLSPFTAPVPYMLSIILNKASKPEDIVDLMLEERHKSRKFREVFSSYEYSIKEAKTLKDALVVKKKINEAITALSRAADVLSTKYINEILSFSEALASPLTNPLDPTSYSKSLLTIPVEGLRHWWTKRKVIYMFSFVKEAQQIKPLIENVNRIWKKPIPEKQIEALPKYFELIINLKK